MIALSTSHEHGNGLGRGGRLVDHTGCARLSQCSDSWMHSHCIARRRANTNARLRENRLVSSGYNCRLEDSAVKGIDRHATFDDLAGGFGGHMVTSDLPTLIALADEVTWPVTVDVPAVEKGRAHFFVSGCLAIT